MPYKTLSVEKRNKGVAWVIVDNPPANAIGTELMDELGAVADELEADESVRVIVVTSNHPKTFLAGADLQGLMQGGDELAADENPIATQSKKMQACFRSEEHTSELQSRGHLVCRLLLEKKKRT